MGTMMPRTDALARWDSQVYRRDDVDPDDEFDWYALAYGFFLGLSYEPDEARELAVEATYRQEGA